MAIGTIQLTLDTFACNHVSDIVVVRGDYESRFINAFITAKGTPILVAPTAAVAINAHRPDGQENPFAGTVNEDGSVCVPLAQWMSDVVGRVKCNISVVSNGKKISTTYFYIQVQETPCDSSDIADDDPRKDLITEVIENENRRQLAENERNSKEQERIAAENSRQSAETQRLADEAVRIENESNRVSAEQSRSNVFNSWANDISSLPSFDARISRNSKRITNLEQGLPDDVFVTDSEAAYIKDVPENALPYAAISKIGGFTNKCDNLFKVDSYYMGTQNGLTATLNADGTVTINGTASVQTVFYFTTSLKLPRGDYYYKTNVSGMGYNSYWGVVYNITQEKGMGYDTGAGVAFTSNGDTFQVQIEIASGKTLNNVVFKPMLNTGSTALPFEPYFEGLRDGKVTQVKSVGANLLNLDTLIVTGNNTYTMDTETGRVTVKFIAVHHPLRWKVKVPKNSTITLGIDNYSGASATLQISDTLQIPSGNAETIDGKISLATGLKSVSVNTGNYEELTFSLYVGEGSNFNLDVFGIRLSNGSSLLPFTPYTEHTLEIPEAVQSLEEYGLGIDNTCYNYIDFEKKQFVKRVSKVDMGGLNWYAIADIGFGAEVPSLKNGDYGKMPNLITAPYETTTACGSADLSNKDDKSITTDFNSNTIYIKDSSYTDISTFKNSMLGVMLVYELSALKTEDISDLITDDNLIGVEGGGTLTFVNGYEYDVPNEVFYQLEGVTV